MYVQNQEPYHDDYDSSKKFHQILFRPTFPVQNRELVQMQTILQEQIRRSGDHLFKQGAMVIPGQTLVDSNVFYVNLKTTYQGSNVDLYANQLVGYDISNSVGLTAKVVLALFGAGYSNPVLVCKYTNTGSDETKTFKNSETLTSTNLALKVDTADTNASGKSSICSIEEGIYYVNGYFALVEKQTIPLDVYSDAPTCTVGLDIVQTVVTPEEDESLLDNAQLTPNFAAPGAHRLKIDLVLMKKGLNEVLDENQFVELVTIKNGELSKIINKTDYSVLERTLARRTFDESGDYVVNGFGIDVREHRSNDRGSWAQGKTYVVGDVVTSNGRSYTARNNAVSSSTAPVHASGLAYDGAGSSGVQWEMSVAPEYNRGIYRPEDGGDATKLAVGIESGKAYVKGFEIEKISKTNVAVDKALEYVEVDNAIVQATVGNFVYVTGLYKLPMVSENEKIDLHNQLVLTEGTATGTKIGTARVRNVEFDSGTIGADTAIYKLFLFDVSVDSGYTFERDVKSFRASSNSFTCNVQGIEERKAGSVSASASTTVTGTGTSFQTDYKVGDYAFFGTTVSRITAIASQTSLTVATAITVTGQTNGLFVTSFKEADKSKLLFQFDNKSIRQVRSSLSTNDTSYTATSVFTGTSSAPVASNCTLVITTTSGTFASGANNTNYLVADTVTGDIQIPSTVNVAGSNATLTLPSSFASKSLRVIATLSKTGAVLTEKTKTLQTSTVTFDTRELALRTVIPLGKADGYKLKSVLMKTGGFDAPTSGYIVDITDRYTFSNGQKESFYDLATISLKGGTPAPTGAIQVIFEFFAHGAGDYFTANSYPSTLLRKDVPEFNGVSLRDVIDFRPRIGDDGASFTSTGGSTSFLPKRGQDLRTDYSYYLPKKAIVSLSETGEVIVTAGVSSLNPKTPDQPVASMKLFDIDIPAETLFISSVLTEKVDNRRYTMRDIGKLDQRISNLEYYTTLSLLEQKTNAMAVYDSQGFNRLKSGFIVDNFNGHNVGDTLAQDYSCSVDFEGKVLQPTFSMTNVNLIEKNVNDSQRFASGYQIHGDLITLPIQSHVEQIKQPIGTRVENINPFAVFTFLGEANVNPQSDEWFDTQRLPDVINNVDGNFDTIANRVGGLETVWNSWETVWSGTRVLDASTTNRITTVTSVQNGVQSRTGSRDVVVESFQRELVDDKVVSTALLPFIRSRNVLVQANALKPNTTMNVFFDGVDVTSYCVAAKKMVYTPVNGLGFDSKKAAGGNSQIVARQISGDPEMCLNKGDVIVGATSGATAVVVGSMYNADTGVYSLYVLNVLGTFQSNEVMTGSLSTATGRFVSLTSPSAVKTYENGSVNFLFKIPASDKVRFRAGVRELKLIDAITDGDATTSARTEYRAQGILQTKQATVNSIRNAEIVREVVRETGVSVSRTFTQSWVDPLAQTFLVDQKGGMFATKVDIFFASKAKQMPVTMEIRNVVNGYPGQYVVPFSRVTLNPSDVKISSNTINVGASTYPAADLPTTFNFPSPVYLEDATEYCIVLLSDSNEYNVWISNIGDRIPGTTKTVTEQPYNGVLFKSQNASTWTADQYQDLMFTLYRAKFATGSFGTVQFTNDQLPLQALDTKPFETRNGGTKIRVYQPNHGLTNTSKVTLSKEDLVKVGDGTISVANGSTTVTKTGGTGFDVLFATTQSGKGTALYINGNLIGVVSAVNNATTLTLLSASAAAYTNQAFTYTVPVNTIPAYEVFKTHVVGDVTHDSYTFTTTTASCFCGFPVVENVKATRNVSLDLIKAVVQNQTFPGTSLVVSAKTTSGKSVHGSEVAYVLDANFKPIVHNENFKFDQTKLIAGKLNEDEFIAGNKSFTLECRIISANESVSPVIDTSRLSLIAVSNRVNDATDANTNVAEIDLRDLPVSTLISFSGQKINSVNQTVLDLMKTIDIGKYVTVAGSASNNGTYLVTDNSAGLTVNATLVTEAAGASVILTNKSRFVDEITPAGSSSEGKYVTKEVKLVTPADMLKIMFAANVVEDASVEVYFKALPAGSTASIDSIAWSRITNNQFRKVSVGSNEFVDVEFQKEMTSMFDRFKVKLVMKSKNQANPPRIKELRVIACV